MKIYPFFSPTLVGLDIQSNGIHLIQLKKIKRQFVIEQTVCQTLPNTIFAEGRIKHWDELCKILSEMTGQLRLKGLPTAIHLPTNLVRMKQIQLPLGLSDTEIETEIKANMQRDLPGIKENLSIDFEVHQQDKLGYQEVYFAAARQEYVTQYITCIHASGLKVVIVDVEAHAIRRAMSSAFNSSMPIVTLVQKDKERIRFMIFHDKELITYQQWNYQESPNFNAELNYRVDMHVATFPHLEIEKIYVCGQDISINEVSNVQIEYINPFQQLRIANNAQYAEDYLIALGLAMREVPQW